ncbi:MAG: mandelate racemase, partial [Cyclobacteriaceae bacterium]
MKRRNFLGNLGLAGTLPLCSFSNFSKPVKGPVKITDVQIIKVTGTKESFDFPYQNQITPMTAYPEHKLPPYPDTKKVEPKTQGISNHYIRIMTNQDVEGFYGLVDWEAAYVVLNQLRSFLIGQDPLAIETLWDKMYRLNRHSRGGHYMMGISAVDNALWDLKGKYFDVPVYVLLGGPTRKQVEVYASCLGYSVLPEDVAS